MDPDRVKTGLGIAGTRRPGYGIMFCEFNYEVQQGHELLINVATKLKFQGGAKPGLMFAFRPAN
jgi:hypothetical protein